VFDNRLWGEIFGLNGRNVGRGVGEQVLGKIFGATWEERRSRVFENRFWGRYVGLSEKK